MGEQKSEVILANKSDVNESPLATNEPIAPQSNTSVPENETDDLPF